METPAPTVTYHAPQGGNSPIDGTIPPDGPAVYSGATAGPETNDHDDEATPDGPILLLASEVKTRPVEWLWENRLERGAFCVVAGTQGVGKGVLTAAIGATITRGFAWPDKPSEPQKPGGVLYVPAEDAIDKSVEPRLKVAEADLKRVTILRHVMRDGERWRFNLRNHLDDLRTAVVGLDEPRLIVIDPLDSYLGGRVDTNASKDVREVLDPLIELAEETNVTILGVKHYHKPAKGGAILNALYRISGSSAFTEIPRCVNVVEPDPTSTGTLLFVALKLSNGERGDAVGFSIQNAGGVPLAAWGSETIPIDTDELLAGQSGRQAPATDRAADWLWATLLTAGGTMPAVEIQSAAAVAGHTEKPLRAARGRLGIQCMRQAGDSRAWAWMLPEDEAAGND